MYTTRYVSCSQCYVQDTKLSKVLIKWTTTAETIIKFLRSSKEIFIVNGHDEELRCKVLH